ncbi:hypothetical protein WJX74_004695 [Apatococcus lobatus]|uniref:Uncharacterized protein n=1 Tax=Apatococcus lobatus TaxID=904363 RepID=A0AAW1Q219_9CHLO
MSQPWWLAPPLHAPPAQQHPYPDTFRDKTDHFWDRFYRDNQRSFYKDRHYLGTEFPELSQGPCKLLEVGCGPGNTAYPLLESNPDMQVWACDTSEEAVGLFKAHPSPARARTSTWVADITKDDLREHAAQASMDFCTMIFVLSAIPQSSQPKALRNVVTMLKPGLGCLLFRDYAAGDYAQQRFLASAHQQQLGDGSFVRGDGTLAYYFSQEELRKLLEAAGLHVVQLGVHARIITNRRDGQVMHRRWIQAKAVRLSAPGSSQSAVAFHGHAANVATQSAPASADELGLKPSDSAQGPGGLASGTFVQQTADAVLLATPGQPAESCHDGQRMSGSHGSSSDHCSRQPSAKSSSGLQRHTDACKHDTADVSAESHQHEGQPDVCDHEAVIASAKRHQPEGRHDVSHGEAADASADHGQHEGQELNSAEASADMNRLEDGELTRHSCIMEWDDVGQEDMGFGGLYGRPDLQAEEEVLDVGGGLQIRCRCVSREHRNTLQHTGLMRWESSLVLARLLRSCPSLISGRRVLEVGSGASPLVSVAAQRAGARLIVSTDGSLPALTSLSKNLDLNASQVVIERARTRCLCWGDSAQLAALLREFPTGFDRILGADILYVAEAIPDLFVSVKALLALTPQALVVLAYMERRVHEAAILKAAAEAGLTRAPINEDVEDAWSTHAEGLYRLLCFQKMSVTS